MLSFSDIGIHIFNVLLLFVLAAAGIALSVLFFMVLLKLNKLLRLKLDRTKPNGSPPAPKP